VNNFCILFSNKFVLVFNLYVNYTSLLSFFCVCLSGEGWWEFGQFILSVFVNYFFGYYAPAHIPNVFCVSCCLLIILY